MSAAVRPLHLPGSHALACIGERVLQALQRWAADWSRVALPATAVRVETVSAGMPALGACVEFSTPAGRLWVRSRPDDKEALAAAVLGSEFLPLAGAADAWSLAALGDALHQRNLALAEALIGESAVSAERQPDPAVFAFGSGAVQVACESLGLYAIADAAALAHVPPPQRPAARRPALRPLLDAVRSAPVSLTVGLGSVELSLSHLLGLEAGDVICLPTRLADRLPVTLEGRPVAGASLGHTGRHKSVQLVSLESSPTHGASR